MKIFKHILILFLSVFSFSSNIFAQRELNFEIDYAQFKYDSITNLVEVYILIDKSSLRTEDNTKNIGLLLNVIVSDSVNNSDIINKIYQFNDTYEENTLGSKVILSTINYAVPFGNYTIEVTVKDKNDTTNYKIIKDFLSVVAFSSEKACISGIQLASDIISNSENENSLFYKHGLEVIPNPTSLFDQKPVMFYYAELYLNNIESKKLILERNIINSYGTVVDQKKRKIISTQNDLVEADVVNLTNFSTGGYLLILTLADSAANTFSKSSKKFYLYNQAETDIIQYTDDPGFLPSEFIYLSEEECDFEFSALRYFLNSDEKKTYNNLRKVEAKRKFLYNYWNNSDFDLTLTASQKRIKFSERVEYVNKKFGTFNKDGISTDRGRVFLKFGAPDDIENHHNDPGAKPYEIWEYNSIDGGVIFIFGDVFGYNNYELIHSTKRGEVYDLQWQRRIFKAY